MIVAGRYSFNNGEAVITQQYPQLLAEVEACIAQVDAAQHRTKKSRESTRQHQILYSPRGLNRAYKQVFQAYDWRSQRVLCDYPDRFYTKDYQPRTRPSQMSFREIDFVKEQLGVEVQFGKHAFMVYNVCAKMTIFRNLGVIDAGIEIVPIRQFALEMSTGVSYFEQFVWDLEQRGVADIDVPVLILGVDR